MLFYSDERNQGDIKAACDEIKATCDENERIFARATQASASRSAGERESWGALRLLTLAFLRDVSLGVLGARFRNRAGID